MEAADTKIIFADMSTVRFFRLIVAAAVCAVMATAWPAPPSRRARGAGAGIFRKGRRAVLGIHLPIARSSPAATQRLSP